LQPLQWSREEHHVFPAEFRAVVWLLVRGHYSADCILNALPLDVLELVIAHLGRDPYAFSVTPAPPGKATGKHDADAQPYESATKRRAVAPSSK
jgi:hypothetical protein